MSSYLDLQSASQASFTMSNLILIICCSHLRIDLLRAQAFGWKKLSTQGRR